MTNLQISDLRPLSMGQLLDRALRLYRRHFLKFVGIIAVFQIPVAIISLFVASSVSTALTDPTQLAVQDFGRGAVWSGIIGIISIVLTQISTAALTQAVSDNYLQKPIGILDSYRKIGNSWLSLIGALIIFMLQMLWIVPMAMLAVVPGLNILVFLLAIPVFGVLMFFASVVIPLVAPIVVLERQRASGAIKRAWHLARQRFWWTFGFTLILSLFSMLIVAGPSALISWILESSLAFSPEASLLVNQGTNLLFSLLYLPLHLTAITLLYIDLRVRLEGFDLAVLSASMGEEVEAGTDEMDSVIQMVPVSHSMKPSGKEIGKFSLITVGFAVIIGGFVALFGVLLYPFLEGFR